MQQYEVKSDVGKFFIGDVCYSLKEKDYDDIWGDENNFQNGVFNIKVGEKEFSFFAYGTAYGDGEYTGLRGFEYVTDAGNIGVVPYELADLGNGSIHRCRLVEGTPVITIDIGEDYIFGFYDEKGNVIDIIATKDESSYDGEHYCKGCGEILNIDGTCSNCDEEDDYTNEELDESINFNKESRIKESVKVKSNDGTSVRFIDIDPKTGYITGRYLDNEGKWQFITWSSASGSAIAKPDSLNVSKSAIKEWFSAGCPDQTEYCDCGNTLEEDGFCCECGKPEQFYDEFANIAKRKIKE